MSRKDSCNQLAALEKLCRNFTSNISTNNATHQARHCCFVWAKPSFMTASCMQASPTVHAFTHMHTCIHMYVHTCAHTHTRTHTHAHARTHARTHTHKLKHSLPWAGLLGMLWYNGSQTTLEMNRIQSFTHSPFCSRNETGHNPSAIQSLRQPPKFNPPLPQLLVQSFSNACTPLTD